MPDSPTRERAGELLNLAGQACWVEQGQPTTGGTWAELSDKERAYWATRAYPAVLAMVVATTPGDAILIARLRGYYDLWKTHGLLERARHTEAAGHDRFTTGHIFARDTHHPGQTTIPTTPQEGA